MSHKKAAGSTNNTRKTAGKRLGVKVFGGQFVPAGGIIIRQRGTKYRAGENTDIGRDHTIYSKVDGEVQFETKTVTKFDGRKYEKSFVNVQPVASK